MITVNKAIFHRIRLGDEQAFRELFYAYFDRLYAWANKILNDTAMSQDVVQDFFVRLWENRQTVSFVNASAFQAYAYKSIYHTSLNLLRDDRHVLNSEHLNPEHLADEPDHVSLEEKLSLLDKAFETLPEQCKRIFLMAKLEGKPYAEIASMLGISVNTVKVQVSKAYHILREKQIMN